jgi:hypothetical protein
MLLQGVREVSMLAAQASAHGGGDPVEPTMVSQSAFDAARARSLNYASLPRGKQIAEQLKKRWRVVLTIAHEPPGRHAHLLGLKEKEPEQDWLTDDYVAYMLKLVARRLNAATVTPSEYRLERAALLKEDRASWLHGAQRLLPNDEQIRTACGSWDNALLLAGLKLGPGRGGHKRLQMPTLAGLLERCHEHHGVLPTRSELQTFARANGIPFPTMKGKNWAATVREWRATRTAMGLATPEKPPPLRERPDYTRDVNAALPGERRQRTWSQAECVASVTRYLAQLSSGQHSTKRGYDAWAKHAADAPRASIFDEHGGWNAVREAALANITVR